MSNQDIALEVSIALATRESKAPAKGWRFRPGVVLFPEARCPYCSDVVKSKAVWLVTKTQLLGQGVPMHGQELVLERPHHPHATPSDICFGTAYDPLQALFGSLNEDSAWTPMDKWLQGKYWGHYCEEMESNDDHEDQFWCEGCGEYYVDGDSYYYSDRSWCRGCFEDRAFNCYNCGESYPLDDARESPLGRNWCSECWAGSFFSCSGCDKTFRLSERGGEEDECEDCYEPPPTCSECGEESDDGLCEGCSVACAECGKRVPTDVSYECAEDIPCSRHYCADHSELDSDCLCKLDTSSIAVNGSNELCVSCGVPSGVAHLDSCVGGNHLLTPSTEVVE